jgi:hypothetical protein
VLHEHFVNRRRGKSHAMQPLQFVAQPLRAKPPGSTQIEDRRLQRFIDFLGRK